MNYAEAEKRRIEANIRATSSKELVKSLKKAVIEHHRAVELPAPVRLWLEMNRSGSYDPAEVDSVLEGVRNMPEGWRFDDQCENIPISGWIVTMVRVLKDGKPWWILSSQRHDDEADMIGPLVPAPATKDDLRRIAKIVSRAGGNPKKELMRTGAITKEEHDQFLAAGKPDIAEYGQIFWWWPA